MQFVLLLRIAQHNNMSLSERLGTCQSLKLFLPTHWNHLGKDCLNPLHYYSYSILLNLYIRPGIYKIA